jgi:hypothetical protein
MEGRQVEAGFQARLPSLSLLALIVIGVASFAIILEARVAQCQTSAVDFFFDENGNGCERNPTKQFIPGSFGSDSGPGGLSDVLFYDLPFPGDQGDVRVLGSGPLQDVIRFNGDGTLIFYSDKVEGGNPGDTGLPTAFYANQATLLETTDPVSYTPTAGQPGFDPVSHPTYFFSSDLDQPATFLETYFDVATSSLASRAGYGGAGSSGGAGDNTVRVVNSTAANGTLCAMFYVFDDFEELQACCGCPVTPDGLRTLSTLNDLTFDFGVNQGNLNQGVIEIVSALPNFNPGNPSLGQIPRGTNGVCSPTGVVSSDIFNRATPVTVTPGLRAWITHDELMQPGNVLGGKTAQSPSVNEFTDATAGDLFRLQQLCENLIQNGSGTGVCTCGVGDNRIAGASARAR